MGDKPSLTQKIKKHIRCFSENMILNTKPITRIIIAIGPRSSTIGCARHVNVVGHKKIVQYTKRSPSGYVAKAGANGPPTSRHAMRLTEWEGD